MKILKKTSKGFTLIELLVVIAIIGILAAIVLVNVRSARMKAQDAAIKGNLATLSAAAEMYYDGDGNGAYTGFCGTADEDRVATKVADLAADDEYYCADADSEWAACGKLNDPEEPTTPYWCVDAAGNAKETTSCSTLTSCP